MDENVIWTVVAVFTSALVVVDRLFALALGADAAARGPKDDRPTVPRDDARRGRDPLRGGRLVGYGLIGIGVVIALASLTLQRGRGASS